MKVYKVCHSVQTFLIFILDPIKYIEQRCPNTGHHNYVHEVERAKHEAKIVCTKIIIKLQFSGEKNC